ncbi:hypothetical protein Tco_0775629 [Tanacetum coccineum]
MVRLKRKMTFKKPVVTRSGKQREGCSKDGGSSNDGEGCNKDVGGSSKSGQGLTCRLDLEELYNGATYFKRFYVCFKGVKYGWLEGCKKVIGLDGFKAYFQRRTIDSNGE